MKTLYIAVNDVEYKLDGKKIAKAVKGQGVQTAKVVKQQAGEGWLAVKAVGSEIGAFLGEFVPKITISLKK